MKTNIAINDLILLETELIGLIGLVLTTYIGWRMVKMTLIIPSIKIYKHFKKQPPNITS